MISKTELEYIRKNIGQAGLHHCLGFLLEIRQRNVTLEEIYQEAMTLQGQEEHRPSFTSVRTFLTQNAEKFGIKTK